MKNILRIPLALAISVGTLFAPQPASANSALWIGNPDVTVSTNWSDNANWNNIGEGTPGFLGNDVLFGNTGAVGADGTINSVVDASGGSLSMVFTNQSTFFHTILIPAGVTLNNTNILTVGSLPALDANATKVNFTGGGTLVQRGNVTVRNNANASGQNSLATLDLSGLSHFVCSNSGTLNVGGVGSETRSAGQLILAGLSNHVTVTTLNLQTTTGNGGNSGGANIRLGAGTNIINANTINIVGGKAVNGTLSFLSETGGLRIRGANGDADDSSRANISIANRNTGGTGTLTGTADFTGGHPVDIKAGVINIAPAVNNPTSANQNGTGHLRFDAGLIDAIAVNLASNNVANANCTANLVIGTGGTLVVSNVSLVSRGAAAGNATGNLFLGGTMNCSGTIAKTTLNGVGNVTITNGTLILPSGRTVGATDVPVDNLELSTATLQLSIAGSATIFSAANLNLVDAANVLQVAALPSIPGFPIQYPIVTYRASAGGGSLKLGSLPGGYSGYVSNDTIGTVWLVITNGPFVAKTDTWAGAVNNEWNTNSLNWTNAGAAVTYNDGDVVVFDDSAQTANVNLTGTRLPAALTVSNNTLNYIFSGVGGIGGGISLVKEGSASLTLTETGGDNFNGGIFVNNGTLILDNPNSAIAGGLTVAAGATAQIGNNSANGVLPAGVVQVEGTLRFNQTSDTTVATAIGGTGSLAKSGGGKLTLAGNNVFTGNSTVSGGTLALAGAGALAASSQVSVSGAGLDLSGKTLPTTLNTLNLANASLSVAMPNVQTPLHVTELGFSGAASTINVTALPPVASYPTSIKLVQAAGPISGFNMTLGTTPVATPAYVGSVALSADQTAVVLTLTAGPVGVRPAVFWTGAELPNLNTNWSASLNWILSGAPIEADNVIFNSTAASTASALTTPGGGASAVDPANINNIVDANFTVASLVFTNLGGTYHNTRLANGRTLSVTNFLTVGAIDAGATAQQQGVSISGAGSVSVSNPASSLQVWLGSPGTAHQTTVDLSALDSFSAVISRLTIGASAVNNAVNRPSGILYLAKTNSINAGFQTTTTAAGTTTGNGGIVVGDCNQNAGTASFLYLGQANTISADTIGLARQKTTATMAFNPIFANVAPYPTVTIQGFTSGRVSIFDVGTGVGNTGTTTGTGTADFSGGTVNLMADTMSVGRAGAPASGSSGGTSTGVLTFDAGTVNVNTLNVGLQPASFHTLKTGIGTVNVGTNATIGAGANLIVNGSLNLAFNAGNATTAGTLNINRGSVQVSNIVAGVNGATSTINLTDGTLSVAVTAGTPAEPLTALNLTGGALRLNVDGTAGAPSLVATTITPNGTTTVNIGAIANVTGTMTIPLIGYTGANPFSSLSLGTYPAGYLVALADNVANSTVDLNITSLIVPKPVITGIVINGNEIIVNGTNGPVTGDYYVLASTNVALPLASWERIATNAFVGGNFSFTNAVNPAQPQRFFAVQLP